MHSVEKTALVMHSAEKMFELVNDVERYQEFLPWCGGSEEISRTDSEVIAKVKIAFKGVKKSFVTRNELIDGKKTVLSLVEGPFSALSGFWEFVSIGEDACRVRLHLNFDFSNRVLSAVVGPVFKIIADSMVDSFCRRADEIYAVKKHD